MIKWLERKRMFAIIFTILIAIEIFYFSSIPGGKQGIIARGINVAIIYHIIVFFLFNFFLLISIKGKQEIKVKHILIAITISLIYAIFDEIHQMFVPFRHSSIQDVLTNSIGIFSSTLLYLYSRMNTQT